jgi:hypothetical protein
LSKEFLPDSCSQFHEQLLSFSFCLLNAVPSEPEHLTTAYLTFAALYKHALCRLKLTSLRTCHRWFAFLSLRLQNFTE